MNDENLNFSETMTPTELRAWKMSVQIERKLIDLRTLINLNDTDARLLLELVYQMGVESPYPTHQVILDTLDKFYVVACEGKPQVIDNMIRHHKESGQSRQIVVYQPRNSGKTFTVGDGSTRFTLPGERPLTGEEKYQKPAHEAILDLGDAITDTAIAIVNAFEPVFKAMAQLSDELMKIPEFRAYLEASEKGNAPAETAKAAARARSRADVREKRKSMMKRRGRK